MDNLVYLHCGLLLPEAKKETRMILDFCLLLFLLQICREIALHDFKVFEKGESQAQIRDLWE
jgi:hypothetical protein